MIKNDNINFCFRCYHTWVKRKKNSPKFCPKCKSPYWNKPRRKVSKQFVLKMKEMIVSIHDAIIKLSGGELGLRDEGGVYNSTYKLLKHQDKNREKPISIGAFALNEFAKRHYFVDGNKRTAYVVAKIFMLINKCHLKLEYSEAVKFILEIAKYESKLSFDDIRDWLNNSCILIGEKDVESYLKNVLVNLVVGDEEDEED